MNLLVVKGERLDSDDIITLEQAKLNSKIDYDYEDDILRLFISSISDEFESYTGSFILEREVSVVVSEWCSKFNLSVTPVNRLMDIKYYDVNGDQKILDPKYYTLFPYDVGKGPFIIFNFSEFPELEENNPYPISINVTAGFKAADIPGDIKKAALLTFGAAELFREDMPVKGSRLVYQLLQPYKAY